MLRLAQAAHEVRAGVEKIANFLVQGGANNPGGEFPGCRR